MSIVTARQIGKIASLVRSLRSFDAALVALLLLFMTVFFLAPLGNMLFLSLQDGENGFSYAAAREILLSNSLRSVLWQTCIVSAQVSIICLIIGYPVASYISRLQGLGVTLAYIAILFPFLTSSLVRTFVFMVLLGRTGVLNSFLEAVGIPGAPFKLLFNHVGVVIGMTYVLLPYMLLSLISSMKSIDKRLLDAATSLGASRHQVFFTVYLPLTLPGIGIGMVLTSILSFGYFVTPKLMGGPSERMIAQLVEQRITSMFDLQGASILALIMMLIILSFYALAARKFGLGRLTRL